mgnify:CR=1 FL=1
MPKVVAVGRTAGAVAVEFGVALTSVRLTPPAADDDTVEDLVSLPLEAVADGGGGGGSTVTEADTVALMSGIGTSAVLALCTPATVCSSENRPGHMKNAATPPPTNRQAAMIAATNIREPLSGLATVDTPPTDPAGAG